MSGPYFETWSHENLVKFAKEAYEKLQRQEEEIQRLRWPFPTKQNANYPDDVGEALL